MFVHRTLVDKDKIYVALIEQQQQCLVAFKTFSVTGTNFYKPSQDGSRSESLESPQKPSGWTD